MNSEHRNQPDITSNELLRVEPLVVEDFVAPGVPIVRSSTPRPLSFGLAPGHGEKSQTARSATAEFPVEAPAAPPLPEEYGEDGAENDEEKPILAQSEKLELYNVASPEFLWLFEYGLDMDTTVLNSAERLNGSALLYGPAVLKGYELAFGVVESQAGPVAATILPSRVPTAEVWGILYRIPHRLTDRIGEELSLLDRAHSPGRFERLEVIVHETYRKRNISCITYIAAGSVRQHFHLPSQKLETFETSYVQRLLGYARKQKLPENYLQELEGYASSKVAAQPPVSPLPVEEAKGIFEKGQPGEPGKTVREQNTEPLVALPRSLNPGAEDSADQSFSNAAGAETRVSTKIEEKATQPVRPGRWFMTFALYVVLLLFTTLALSIIQALGFWSEVFTASFAPLGVPWFVLMYGLIGGCISCIVAIGRREELRGEHKGVRALTPPGYVILTWFTRPFIGVVLAALAYLLLNSGLFVFSASNEQRFALFSLVGASAGLCERWIFFRWT